MNELFYVNNIKLDDYQIEVLKNNNKNLLVVASAGSGKTFTMIGKINYLIKHDKIHEDEILCISFTNETCDSLRNKLKDYYNYNIEVLTFHKLALKLLKMGNKYYKISNNTLEYLIDEYFDYLIYDNYILLSLTLKFLNISEINKQSYMKVSRYDKNNLKKSILTYINILKTNGYDIYFVIKLINKEKNNILSIINKKKLYFLYIVLIILNEYNIEMNSESKIDFNDMISLACAVKCNLKYKYVIVDEFQDTSIIRLNLLKNVLMLSDASLVAVGDDYQSIYAFSGCDLSIFLNFNKEFNDSKILYLVNTYRNSQELIDVAGDFIIKDKRMLSKKLISEKRINKPIKIIYYKKNNEFIKLLEYLYINNKKNILILGRNNIDIFNVIDSKYISDNIIKYKNMNIKYLTVHKSKGLEEDDVIVISLIDDEYGFPSKVRNAKYLNDICNKGILYNYYEERRLFYVSITRCKNNVYLFVNKRKPSKFIRELIKNYKTNIEIIKL